ncbi:MAG: hypothetical protein ACTSU2_14115 [Promethearchaeota archaeon]
MVDYDKNNNDKVKENLEKNEEDITNNEQEEDQEQWLTRREKILNYLEESKRPLDLHELYIELEYNSKRDLLNDIKSLEMSLKRKGRKLLLIPARCAYCGFIFRGRKGNEGFSIPSKCPKCKHENIVWPSIYLK